jgi:hypothetical protein
VPKFGNSNTRERIELIERYIRLFGIEALDCLTADQEFVGEEWIKHLNVNRIRYYIRIHENFWVVQPHNGKRAKASWLFTNERLPGESPDCLFEQPFCYLSASKGKDKKGKPELQIIISFNKPEDALGIYKERWQIETLFFVLFDSPWQVRSVHGEMATPALGSGIWLSFRYSSVASVSPPPADSPAMTMFSGL